MSYSHWVVTALVVPHPALAMSQSHNINTLHKKSEIVNVVLFDYMDDGYYYYSRLA